MGIGRFDDEARAKGVPLPRVLAHEAMPARFERYKLTAGYNSCINTRQFQMPITWPDRRSRAPDVLFAWRPHRRSGSRGGASSPRAARRTTILVGLIPSKKLLCTGDLFLWCCPNARNLQKVQRYPNATGRRRSDDGDCSARRRSPRATGVPIVGADRVKQALSETAELLETLHDRTVEMINAGARLRGHRPCGARAPSLLGRPYPAAELPTSPSSIRSQRVAALWCGGWDGDPSRPEPAPREVPARSSRPLAGGVEKPAARAMERPRPETKGTSRSPATSPSSLGTRRRATRGDIEGARGRVLQAAADGAVADRARGSRRGRERAAEAAVSLPSPL